MRAMISGGVTGVSSLGVSAVARACTVCDSAAGHALRARIFDEHFLRTAAMLLAPFPVFAAAVVWLFLGLPVRAGTWRDAERAGVR